MTILMYTILRNDYLVVYGRHFLKSEICFLFLNNGYISTNCFAKPYLLLGNNILNEAESCR